MFVLPQGNAASRHPARRRPIERSQEERSCCEQTLHTLSAFGVYSRQQLTLQAAPTSGREGLSIFGEPRRAPEHIFRAFNRGFRIMRSLEYRAALAALGIALAGHTSAPDGPFPRGDEGSDPLVITRIRDLMSQALWPHLGRHVA